ncbi:DUF5333 domain-containing protein [Actibacterium sp.]|uniref:DUF5333 domain-containing protein n=1 Tax=Actibacterium sp. TaxID=1872125 RepID=UPI003561E3D3
MKHLKTLPFVAGLALVASTTGGAASANGLREMQAINDGLTVIAAGDLIQKNCETIKPRLFRAYSYAKELEFEAKQAGFTDDEIEDYVSSKEDRKRVKSVAFDYLLSQGLDPQQPASYCTVGLAEIERNSQIGVLLKAK